MEKRNHMIMVRLTEDEWKELQTKSDSLHLNVSSFIRMALLSEKGAEFIAKNNMGLR
jgi:hypothetical protein